MPGFDKLTLKGLEEIPAHLFKQAFIEYIEESGHLGWPEFVDAEVLAFDNIVSDFVVYAGAR